MEQLPRKRKQEEGKLQSKVLAYLRKQPDMLVARTDTQSVKDNGLQDITCLFKGGLYIAIELKKPKGGIQSKAQIAWQKRVEDLGGVYWLVSDYEKLQRMVQGLREGHDSSAGGRHV